MEKDEWIELPQTLSNAKIGKKLSKKIKWDKSTLNGLKVCYEYEGSVWFHTRISGGKMDLNTRYVLYLERLMGKSKIWIDGIFIGSMVSYSIPHRYDITDLFSKEKEHELVIQTDNRDEMQMILFYCKSKQQNEQNLL